MKLPFSLHTGPAGLQGYEPTGMLNMSERFVAAAWLFGCLSIAASPQIAAAGMPPEVLLVQAQPQPPAQAPNVEANIASLHQRLQIMPAQEAQFNAVANVMRQNARAEASAPHAPPGNASAVDNLRAEIQYDEIELAGMKRFLPALEALYAILSPTQRQTANVIFSQGPGG